MSDERPEITRLQLARRITNAVLMADTSTQADEDVLKLLDELEAALRASQDEQAAEIVFLRNRNAHADEVIEARNRRLSEVSVASDVRLARAEKAEAELEALRASQEGRIANGNTFIFCDYVQTRHTIAEPRGCIRGAGHNGPHVVQQIDDAVRAPVLLTLADEASAPSEGVPECPHGENCACVISTRHEWFEAFCKERENLRAEESKPSPEVSSPPQERTGVLRTTAPEVKHSRECLKLNWDYNRCTCGAEVVRVPEEK